MDAAILSPARGRDNYNNQTRVRCERLLDSYDNRVNAVAQLRVCVRWNPPAALARPLQTDCTRCRPSRAIGKAVTHF